MKYDSLSSDENHRLDEIFLALDKWLKSFLPGEDRAMFGSAEEMQRYIDKWTGDFRRLAARYRDAEGNHIGRKTIGRTPISALRLYLTKVMMMPENEIDAVLSSFNRHPMTVKSGLNLRSPLTVSDMASVDANGDPVTIEKYLMDNSAAKGGLRDWKSIDRFLDGMLAMMATRKMEIHNLGDATGKTSGRKSYNRYDDYDDDDDELSSRISALRAGIDQLIKMDEASVPAVGKTWNGGLSESMLSNLAFIAEASPDVYSIVKRAWSQGHDADTIKQMLQSLSYPTKDVDKIISKLEAKKTQQAPTAAQPSSQAPSQPAAAKEPPAQAPSQPPEKTIYVDRSGKASYDSPSKPSSGQLVLVTGDDYIDSVLNTALRKGGKEQAMKTALGLLTRYVRDERQFGRRATDPRGGSKKDRDPFSTAVSTVHNLDRWLRQYKSGPRKG